MNEIVTRLTKDNIVPLWKSIALILEPATKLRGTHSLEDIFKALENDEAQIWVQWDGQVKSVVITEIKNYPQGRVLKVWLAGAVKKAEIMWKKFEYFTSEFAKANKCLGMEIEGRPGWERLFPHDEKIATVLFRRF